MSAADGSSGVTGRENLRELERDPRQSRSDEAWMAW